MASLIDETKPVTGTPTTQSVRANFAAAKGEIEALQQAVAAIPAGSGDMLASVYDPDADGKVLAAETADAVPWAGVGSKPATYPPDTHGHGITDIVGLVAALAEKATPADIANAIAALVDTSPAALDTLNELAAALGDDPNFATTITNALAAKAAADHNHTGTYEPADATILKSSAIGSTVQGYDADTAKLDVGQTFTRPQKAGTQALTHNTAWDGSQATGAQHLTVNVNGSSFTIANPSTHEDGVTYKTAIHFTTAHGVAFGNAFKGLAGYVATATAGADDTLFFRSNGTNLICEGYAMNGGA